MNAQVGEHDPAHVLRQAIAEALPQVQAVEPDANDPVLSTDTVDAVTETVNAVLLAFTRTAAPVANELTARAAQQPGGRLATAMSYLRDAFARLATGAVSPACIAMALAQSELDQLD